MTDSHRDVFFIWADWCERIMLGQKWNLSRNELILYRYWDSCRWIKLGSFHKSYLIFRILHFISWQYMINYKYSWLFSVSWKLCSGALQKILWVDLMNHCLHGGCYIIFVDYFQTRQAVISIFKYSLSFNWSISMGYMLNTVQFWAY